MNEPSWYEMGITAVAAGFGWALKRFMKRIDDIKETYVTREELGKAMEQLRQERQEMRDDRLRMHEENTAALQYIRERVDSLVDRRRARDT